MMLARGRERAEWDRWISVECFVTGKKPVDVMPRWLRDPEPEPEKPTAGDTRRFMKLMGIALGMGDDPEGW